MGSSADVQSLFGELDFDPVALKRKYLAERDKRIRADGNDQYVEVTAEFSHYVDDPYVEPGFTREPREKPWKSRSSAVVSAVCWRAPGCVKPDSKTSASSNRPATSVVPGTGIAIQGRCVMWNPTATCRCSKSSATCRSTNTPFAPEILEHSKRIARHYQLYDKALLQTGVKELRWDEDAARWIISTDRNDRIAAQYVAMANGPLSRPKLPGIPGINDFKGTRFTPAAGTMTTPEEIRAAGLTGLKDKRVGIIGTGATAVQCIPHLGEWAKSLHVFQRTPSSIDVRNNAETDHSGQTAWNPAGSRRAWTTSIPSSAAAIRRKIWSAMAGPTSSVT